MHRRREPSRHPDPARARRGGCAVPALTGSAEVDGAPIRLVSWNVHGYVGSDFRCDPERTFGVILRLKPDILALQEIDGRTHLGRRPRAFETFAEALGDHRVEARLLRRADRDYGHLLWSRWPLDHAGLRVLPGGRIEPRAVIDAVAATPAGPLRILATHFGLFPGDRRRQADALAGFAAEGALATVAVGDFNEWRREGGVHRRLSHVLPTRLDAPTFPSRRPFVRMDRLYASAGLSEVRSAEVEDEVLAMAARASDHLPLSVDLSLPASA